MAQNRDDLIRSETRVLAELAALHRDPVFYGQGVPRGDRRLVVVVPGLFGNDYYLQPLRTWLALIGYTPVRSSINLNAGCPERIRNQVMAKLTRRLGTTDRPVALVGHSRGGMLSWAIASHLGEQVSHLALLGSPAAAVVAMMRQRVPGYPASVAAAPVANAGARALRLMDPDCTVPDCGCPYVEDIRQPLHPSTRVLSVFSSEDPVVAPGASRVPGAENVEVTGTHSGLVYNRKVYPHLARFLATT